MLTRAVLGLAYNQEVLLRKELVEKDKYARPLLRPNRAIIKSFTKKFLHSSYDLEYDESTEAGKTGLLELFYLRSRDAAFPDFAARGTLERTPSTLTYYAPRSFRSSLSMANLATVVIKALI